MTRPRILAVVPARGGSKGLPGKNIRPLAGLPLIAHSIRAAALTPQVSRCVVSTDSTEIAAVARQSGGDVPFLRPAELARDDTPMAPVVRHALEWCEREEGEPYAAVLLLDPTSPARVPQQLAAAADLLFSSDGLDGVISVSEPTFNPVWVGVRPGSSPDGALERYFAAGTGVTRRQDTERFRRINGNFYLWRADFVRRLEQSWFDEGRHAGAEIPEAQAFSIDDEYEFRLIEALVAADIITLPWLERS
ncbi:cytidylyltransferase domain-containing protein [Intrasporangium calvum]|uniref:Acylneuraminate cytidylyltransferase n=1 Tax=Intrasporangium calvum (strain ATCC 23552 / DSM 43043 / JCM 3097 / NBRC 12989 / NCIMB 10167 / NRRL B-3866 / 7 KIP) TaxID=710696 RepID=E6SFM9_INTC7|nr:acylneuraminate cytidylyltransferase family protein [Intrasporangium calvum]ADU47774.1 acylneuraminate cytidylyltransferase [Intrasporangium calvum DSM 43043]